MCLLSILKLVGLPCIVLKEAFFPLKVFGCGFELFVREHVVLGNGHMDGEVRPEFPQLKDIRRKLFERESEIKKMGNQDIGYLFRHRRINIDEMDAPGKPDIGRIAENWAQYFFIL